MNPEQVTISVTKLVRARRAETTMFPLFSVLINGLEPPRLLIHQMISMAALITRLDNLCHLMGLEV